MESTEVDAGEHLPLINRVIGQMNLYGDMAEEAFSEGLVAITEAAQKYDPTKGVPLANWLAMNIRWSLKTWIIKQRFHQYFDGFIEIERVELQHYEQNTALEFKELISKMEKVLTLRERQILLADAMGYSGKRIASVLRISQVQVSKIKKRAQEKLRREENSKV